MAILTVALGGIPDANRAGAESWSDWSFLPSSSSLVGDAVVAEGSLLDIRGHEHAGGTVVLFAEPANETLEAMEDGNSVELRPISRTVFEFSRSI